MTKITWNFDKEGKKIVNRKYNSLDEETITKETTASFSKENLIIFNKATPENQDNLV